MLQFNVLIAQYEDFLKLLFSFVVDQPSIVFKKFLKNEDFSFLCSPAWCLILTSQHCEVIHGVENLTMQLSLPMSELISAMLQENFTIPLIDVLLAVPTTTTLCKTEELKQLEILARHFFQRKGITFVHISINFGCIIL